MLRRVVRILVGVMLIPVLAGIGPTPCAAMGHSLSMSDASVHGTSDVSQEHSAHAGGDQTGVPLHQHSRGQCDNSTGTNCCPAVSGCSVIALPAVVTATQTAAEIVTSAPVIYKELPTTWAVAPEPPPPKA